MIENFPKLHEGLKDKSIPFSNKKFFNIINNYDFYLISDSNKLCQSQIQKINQNLEKSKVMVIGQHKFVDSERDEMLTIFGFEQTLLVIENSSLSFVESLFSTNTNLFIIFLSNTKDIFINIIKTFPSEEVDHNFIFKEEIRNFNLFFTASKIFNQIWENIKSCISAYLIKKSYYERNENRIDKFDFNQDNSIDTKIFDENEYIELRVIGIGSNFRAVLIYHIEKGNIYIIKKQHVLNNEISKLKMREERNYKALHYPLIPRFYGTVKKSNDVVIEFINGRPLSKIDELELNEADKISIIFQLMLVICYIHDQQYIYRDLKPNNVLIDLNKTVVLIDFDRLIKNNNDQNFTFDLSSPFLSPEVNSGKFTNKCDIYSLGMMMKFIMKNEQLNINSKIQEIYQKCVNVNPDDRPSIYEVIQIFANEFIEQIDNENSLKKLFDHYIKHHDFYPEIDFSKLNDDIIYKAFLNLSEQNIREAQYILGVIHLNGQYVKQNISKAIQFFQLASTNNLSEAQYHLGLIYYDGIYLKRDIDKSIHYFQLAADQNHPESLYNLGVIYYDGKYVQQDIKKTIQYYLLAAEQNHPGAQYNLGLLYYNGEYIKKNINKAIHYFTLASNQNISNAQYNLSKIYLEGIHASVDINKSLYYLTLAANGNNVNAQFDLALIYLDGEIVPQDVKKTVHYFKLAADQNHPEAQYNYGLFYFDGKYLKKDVTKAIHYYTLAANQGVVQAQYDLAVIYYENKYSHRDFNKALHYFLMASNQNYLEAHFYIGLIFHENRFIKQDIKKAIHYYSLAANQNHARAQFNLATIYIDNKYNEQDINKAIYYYSLAANQNMLQAQKILGSIYYENILVPQNIDKAIHYFLLAANQNDSSAQLDLGRIYFTGKYVKQDIKKGIHYFTLAANQNNSDAQYCLGNIFCKHQSIPKDMTKAIYYYSLAAKQNNSKAQFNLGYIYYKNENGINIDINKAIHYFTLSASQQNSDALYFLGEIYFRGKYVQQDVKKGIDYFLLSSKQSNSQAQFILGNILLEGKYIKQDISAAINYFTLASNQNHSFAQYMLAQIYYSNEYVERNSDKCIFFLTESSKNRFILAHFNLAFLYHEGKFIERDINKAIFYYKEASSLNIQYAKNNLGIIYKNGFENDISKNIFYACELFEEAIHQKSDKLAMFNLASIHIFDETIKKDIDKSIELLIKLSNLDFQASYSLLSIALIRKIGFDLDLIQKEINSLTDQNSNLCSKICQIIESNQLNDEINFEKQFKKWGKIDFLYDFSYCEIPSIDILNQKRKYGSNSIQKINEVTSEFYKGFDI